jgi:D-arginine dehydrogenase
VTEPAGRDDERAAAAEAVDVAIVGGGIAGMSLAAELAGQRSVAVLEQEPELGQHATGRSAAVLLESYGGPPIRALTRASHRMLDEAADDPPVLAPRPLLWIGDAEHAGAVADLAGAVVGLEPISPADAQQLYPVLRPEAVAAAAVERNAHDIDVAVLLQGYVTRAVAAGATVRRSARLERAERVGGRWLLHHPSGTVAADVVVDAAGAWADEVARRLGARSLGLTPMRRTIAIARSAQPIDPHWPLVASIDDTFYFRPEGPNLLVSPADETPSEPCDARPEELDVALALERVNAATDLGLRSVVSTWAGLRTFAPDRSPVVGFDPTVEGLFWLAGQGGYGIQTAPALAKLAAALLLGDPAAGALVPDLDLADLAPARLA